MRALGADEVIIVNEIDIEKELQLHDKYETSINEIQMCPSLYKFCKMCARPRSNGIFQFLISILHTFFYYRFDAIFYTDNQPFQEHIFTKYLLPHGSYVSTVPEQLTSDSLGFICGSIFAGCVRIKLLVQVWCVLICRIVDSSQIYIID